MPIVNKEVDLDIESNASLKLLVEVYDADDVAIDISSYGARWMLRDDYDTAALITASTSGGQIVVGSNTALMTIPVSSVQSLSLTVGVHDFLLDAPDGTTDRLFFGKATYKPGVTRG